MRYSWTAGGSTTPAYELAKYTFTGQRSYTSDFGLLFYVSRMYDPLGRFNQADSVVPVQSQGVQAWDRYAYVSNNPILYVDPSGHGIDCGIGMGCVKDYSGASTLDNFLGMGWNERKHWLNDFTQENHLGNWFNDIEGAIEFMSTDKDFRKEGSIAEVMDAAVLQAINDGWRLYKRQNQIGGGGQGWVNFFILLDTKKLYANQEAVPQTQINIARLAAEQFGVDYSYGLVDVKAAINNADDFENIYFDVFKTSADKYREFGIKGSVFNFNLCSACAGQVDPRVMGPVLVDASRMLRPTAWFIYGQYLQSKHPPK